MYFFVLYISSVIIFQDCAEGTAKCYFFKCYFRELQADKNALIQIRSRLWSKTFVEVCISCLF